MSSSGAQKIPPFASVAARDFFCFLRAAQFEIGIIPSRERGVSDPGLVSVSSSHPRSIKGCIDPKVVVAAPIFSSPLV